MKIGYLGGVFVRGCSNKWSVKENIEYSVQLIIFFPFFQMTYCLDLMLV